MKLLIPAVFLAATVAGVVIQLSPSRTDSKLAEIKQRTDAEIERINRESEAQLAKKLAEIEQANKRASEAIRAYEQSAKDHVRRYVLSRLKAPATAQFGPIEFRIPQTDNKRINSMYWVCDGYVDSHNSFGAFLRTYYTLWIGFHEDRKRWETVIFNTSKNGPPGSMIE